MSGVTEAEFLMAKAVKNSKPWAKLLGFLLFPFLPLENVITVCHLRVCSFETTTTTIKSPRLLY